MFGGTDSALLVTGGTFTVVNETHTHHHISPVIDDGREGIRLLQQKISLGAFHNSEERYDPPKCHPRTREAIKQKILQWIRNPNSPFPFLWMYGPAGAGKSAIAQTIAELCHQENLLAAAYFFSRTAAGRDNKTNLILTLVYQLTISIPETRIYVGKTLEQNPTLLSMSLKAQMKALFIDALNSVASLEIILARPRLFIVDGLDECGDAESQEYILQVLSEAMHELSVKIFFLISSRPEQHIRESFNENLMASLTTTIILDDTYKPDEDIRLFLQDKFEAIRRKHPAKARFPATWPWKEAVDHLVKKSSGQFIYVATVMKYIESRRHLPADRLQVILGLADSGGDTPFAQLDALYLHIFSCVGDLDKVTDLFRVLLLTEDTTIKRIPADIEQFLFYKPGEIDIILSELHSIISVPPPGDTGGILHISHASLSDFLVDRSRSGKFFIDAGVGHVRIATVILRHISLNEHYKWRELSTSLFNHGFRAHRVKAQPTPELLDALYNFDLGTFLNRLSDSVTPKRGNGPLVSRSKVSLDDHWPNIPRFLFWLESHCQSDPNKDLRKHFRDAFDFWMRTQLAIYPQMPGTRYLLTAATFRDFQHWYRTIFEIINNGINWDPADVSDMINIDPIHFFNVYKGDGYNARYYASLHGYHEYYYDAISQFLVDPSRAREYCIRNDEYIPFLKLIVKFILDPDPKSYSHPWNKIPAIELLPEAFNLVPKTAELSAFLEHCAQALVCNDKDHPLYMQLNDVADAIKAYRPVRRDIHGVCS